MPTQIAKKIDFTGKELFIGLDVHKKSWSVTVLAIVQFCSITTLNLSQNFGAKTILSSHVLGILSVPAYC